MDKPEQSLNWPVGTVTFLFTDIEGSTQLWEQAPEEMMRALARHDEIIEGEVAGNHGAVVRPRGEGDSRFAVFEGAGNAVAAAAAIQEQFHAHQWPTPRPLKVRMALHTGAADLRMGDYYGPAVNRCARLRSIAHGGQTVLSRSTWELVNDSLPAGVSLKDEGEHRLKDLSRPEHVFQLCILELPQEFPPLRSLTVIPNNLPILLTDFVGREETIREIRRLLQGTRLLTLVGPGGIGKSRLSIESAAKVADQFKHGVYFVALAPIPSAEFVTQAVATDIGLSLAGDEEPRQQLINFLRGKQLLLVIDNFEHVIEAAGLVDEILRGAPDVKVLATSRIKLNLNGETVYPVSGLSLNGQGSAAPTGQNEAVQLFVATARQARPGFEVGQDDVAPLQRILSLVQGSPLGILLAASWVDMLTVGEIAAEIGRSFDFLETDQRNVPDRQRSIRAAFDYSWRLLAESERELFATLSVFRGGFTRQAAEKVAGASLRQLANLANKSFLSTSPESGRYFVHELLRQYGEGALREDVERYDAARVAHDRFYASFMAEAWFRFTHEDQPQALLDVEADIDNVTRAWRHLVAVGDPDLAVDMIRSLFAVHEIRGWYVTAEEIFRQAAEVAGRRPASESSRTLVAMCESSQSWFTTLLGRPDAGVAMVERAVRSLRGVERPEELAFVFCQMFMSLYLSAQPARMISIGQEAIELTDDPWIRGFTYLWLMYAARSEGNLEAREAYATIVENMVATTRNYWSLYWWHLGRAMFALDRGDFASCRDALEQTLTMVKAIKLKRGLHHTLYNLGTTARALEDYSSAQAYLLEGMRVSDELGGTTDKVSALVDLAITLSATGETERALEMAATAYAHPLSDRITIFNVEPIRERASSLRVSLEGALDPGDAEAAWQRGLAADFDRLVAGLIESSSARELRRGV